MSRPTPGAILEALRDAVTIVEPGEILAVRVSAAITDHDRDVLREHAEHIRYEHGVTILFVAGEEFARIKAGERP